MATSLPPLIPSSSQPPSPPPRGQLIFWKIHYFLWFAALSGILPYYVVFVRTHAQVTATWIGILFALLPFSAFLFNPIFCSLADKFNAHHKFLITFMILTLSGYGLLLTVPMVSSSMLSWLLSCVLLIIAYPSMATVISLTDSMVMRATARCESKNFGQIRVWGTIGFGIFGLITGPLNNFNSGLPYLELGFIMFIVILLIDLAIFFVSFRWKKLALSTQQNEPRIPVPRQDDNPLSALEEDRFIEPSKQDRKSGKRRAWKKFFQTFVRHPRMIQYTLVLTAQGMLMACHWSYFYWFIESVAGPDTLLMGLCLLVACFLGELTFFYFGSHIVKKLGPSNAFSISLAAFTVQYLCYGLVIVKGHHYLVLLVEVLQGPTFGLFYCAMTHVGQEFSVKKRPNPGTSIGDTTDGGGQNDGCDDDDDDESKVHATLQGFLAGCLEGLGAGMGSLLAGLIIDHYGVRTMWLSASALAFILLIFNVLAESTQLIFRERPNTI